MNSYDLSRKFIDFSFENPTKIRPNHYAIYFFAIEHCNRLGWKKEFGLPTTMVMEGTGIRSYNTYSKTIKELVNYGFIEMIEKSRNQYSSNIIALSNFNKALDKALDKALIKHSTKHSIKHSTKHSTKQSEYKQTINNKQINNKQDSFNSFWIKYPNKVAKAKCEKKFLNLKYFEIEEILNTLDDYIAYKPFRDYVHPNPTTYLNQERWKDEIKKNEKPKEIKKVKRSDFYSD